MDTINYTFSLPEDFQVRNFDRREWFVFPDDLLARHRPSNCIFQIYPSPDLPPNHALEVQDMVASLVHVCEDRVLLDLTSLERIGRAAIVAFMVDRGYWDLDEGEEISHLDGELPF